MIEPDIIGFHGIPRSGKTLGLTAWGRWYMLAQHKKLYTNYEIAGGTTITPLEFLQFLKAGASWAHNSPLYDAVFCGQEFQTWLESRLGTSRAAVALTDVVCQAPKLGIKLGYDCQLPSSVDKRLKQNASARFECEKTSKGFRYWALDLKFTEDCVRTGRKKFLSLEYAKKYVMPYYNTRKVSLRPDFEETLMQMEKQDPQLMIATIDRQAALIRDNRHLLADKTTIAVKYALLKLHEPIGLADYVANALKLTP